MIWIIATGGAAVLSGAHSIWFAMSGQLDTAGPLGFWSIVEAMICVTLIAFHVSETQT